MSLTKKPITFDSSKARMQRNTALHRGIARGNYVLHTNYVLYTMRRSLRFSPKISHTVMSLIS